MYIDSLELHNIRTFVGGKPLVLSHPDRDYRLPNSPKAESDDRLPRPRLPNVTLFLGNNGSGKTTILRALAAAAFGPAAKDILRDGTVVRNGESKGCIRAELRLHPQDHSDQTQIVSELELRRQGERLEVVASKETLKSNWEPVNESKNDAFFIVGYGATRRVERLDRYDSGARSQSRSRRDQRVMSLFEDSFSLIPLSSWLPQLKSGNPGRYTQVVHLINKLLAPGQYRFTGTHSETGDYLFERGGMSVAFPLLSDGYRAFIGWVADLLYHVCYGCPSGHKLVESCGVVLVDEIDLHLHPKWQMRVISTISKTLPRMQFVFTSHSPLIAGSLEWMNIITLKVAGKSNRTVAKRLKQSIHGLDADQILLSDFFGLKTTLATAKRRQLNTINDRNRAGDADAPLLLIQQMSRGTEVEG